MELFNKHLHLIPIFLLHVMYWFSTTTTLRAQAPLTKQTANNAHSSVSAILVFGDSTVDPGNNNYEMTMFKSNFQPYGRDFLNQKPTGRFTNGRLSTDYIASYAGVKEYVPPYLEPSLSIEEMMTGVSFASAGSGFDPLTPGISNVIPIQKQMEYFREYKKRLESAVGKQQAESHIKKAVFIVSAGTNDFVVNYFTLPIRRNNYTVSAYQQFLIQHVSDFIQGLWAEGARKIGVAGLPPMGCLPIVITLNSENAILQRGCIEYYSAVARKYNLMLQNQLHVLHNTLSVSGAPIYYLDVYGPLMDMIQGSTKFGIDVVNSGCCGSGYLEASFMCNPQSYACPDASKYVFWDSIHPTEFAYYIVFKHVRPVLDLLIKD
ncbi:hypothetical protein FNV43_RR07498 [Rhamnella rubrinervis]|uniref:Uncharacterized protein n=1 Tax=Rhamnella rubrinervis TaxID=2594499 RepID=A0A8K0MMS9_9ROSA|nr:hypothetical protein FNV43_RR07498 [Rhamnella rubrinervis]